MLVDGISDYRVLKCLIAPVLVIVAGAVYGFGEERGWW